MPIYKYFTAEAHANSFMEKGALMFRPLSYFRAIEDGEVRGDPNDGTLTYAPEGGLVLTKEDGTTIHLDGWRFSSAAKHDEIYVFCVSNILSADLAARFGTPICVEVFDPEIIANRLKARAHADSKLDYGQTQHARIDYRDPEQVPEADWALPEKIAFIKPPLFAWQDEYRYAVGRRNALDVHNVEVTLTSGTAAAPVARVPPPIILQIGKLSDHVAVHRF